MGFNCCCGNLSGGLPALFVSVGLRYRQILQWQVIELRFCLRWLVAAVYGFGVLMPPANGFWLVAVSGSVGGFVAGQGGSKSERYR